MHNYLASQKDFTMLLPLALVAAFCSLHLSQVFSAQLADGDAERKRGAWYQCDLEV